MRVLIQRVSSASVFAEGRATASIERGLLVLAGIEDRDTDDDVAWLAGKICSLRIFNDDNGVMNVSLKDVGGDVIVVSQFTLHASVRKGSRPSYIRASAPPHAVPLYNKLIETISLTLGRPVGSGIFGADMQVSLVNDGPVTIWIDSQNRE